MASQQAPGILLPSHPQLDFQQPLSAFYMVLGSQIQALTLAQQELFMTDPCP